jgi:protein TonB
VIAIHSVDHSFYAFKTNTGEIAFVSSADVDLVPTDPSKPQIRPVAVKTVGDVTVADAAPPPPEAEPDTEPGPGPRSLETSAGRSPLPGSLASPAEPQDVAVLLERVEPRYPEPARRAGIQGTVELEATIGPDGSVTNVEVVRGLPFGVSEAAADAVRKWRYRPAQSKDGPVASRKSIRILFTLSR